MARAKVNPADPVWVVQAVYTDPNLTGMQACERFARTHWPEPRPIERWSGMLFLPRNCGHWYTYRLGKIGWEILRTDTAWDAIPDTGASS